MARMRCYRCGKIATERYPCKVCGSDAHMPQTVQVVFGDPDYDGVLYETTIHGVSVRVDEEHNLYSVDYPIGGQTFWIYPDPPVEDEAQSA